MRAELRLDLVDSCGHTVRSINVASARLMALSLREKSMWYGFVITESDTSVLAPGTTKAVRIAFLDDIGARHALPVCASILFGDGVCAWGVLVLSDD